MDYGVLVVNSRLRIGPRFKHKVKLRMKQKQKENQMQKAQMKNNSNIILHGQSSSLEV
jgi:hypothetical protein